MKDLEMSPAKSKNRTFKIEFEFSQEGCEYAQGKRKAVGEGEKEKTEKESRDVPCGNI